jgi:hypothetical protein
MRNSVPFLEFVEFGISQIESITGLCESFLFCCTFLLSSMVAVSFLEMSSAPTAETWLAEILLSDQSSCSFDRRVPYRHHKDDITQL